MAEKLRSISRNPLFISALDALLLAVPLWLFFAYSGWIWATLYILYALLRYSRPIFNVSGPFPLFLCVIFLPFLIHLTGPFLRVILTALVSLSFAVLLGVKNLTLTHREVWVHCVAYVLTYVALLAFFAGVPGPSFAISWVLTLLFLYCVFRVTIPNASLAPVAAAFTGEMLWIVSWLPVGYLSSANFLLLVVLFLVDTAHEGYISLRSKLLFPMLSLIIAASSYWRL